MKSSKPEHITFSVPHMDTETEAYISKRPKAKWRLICLPGSPSQPYLFSRLLSLASDNLEIVAINRLGFHKSHAFPVLDFTTTSPCC